MKIPVLHISYADAIRMEVVHCLRAITKKNMKYDLTLRDKEFKVDSIEKFAKLMLPRAVPFKAIEIPNEDFLVREIVTITV